MLKNYLILFPKNEAINTLYILPIAFEVASLNKQKLDLSVLKTCKVSLIIKIS